MVLQDSSSRQTAPYVELFLVEYNVWCMMYSTLYLLAAVCYRHHSHAMCNVECHCIAHVFEDDYFDHPRRRQDKETLGDHK